MNNVFLNIRRIRNLIPTLIIIIFISCNNSTVKKDFYTGGIINKPGKGSIKGYVLNSENNFPVPGALINLSNGMSQVSDSNGYYFFLEIPAGEIEVTIEADNFFLFIKKIYVFNKQDLEIDFRITPIPGPGVDVTVATFNVKDLRNENSHLNTAKFIANEDVDIIVFQEIQTSDEIVLKTELANLGVTMPHIVFNNDSFGDDISVWSKYPVTESYSFIKGYFPDPVTGCDVRVPRYILKFKVIVDSHEVWFYSCHLKAGDGEENLIKRRAQAYALSNYIKTTHIEESENIIILGDINTADPEDYLDQGTMGFLTFKNDNPHNLANDFVPMNYTYLPLDDYTFHNKIYDSILDHIILSPALLDNYIDNSIDVVHPEGDPSDHYPVLLRLYFELS